MITPKVQKTYRWAALLFTIAGLLWTIAAFLTDKPGAHVPIGMMNIVIGMMFLNLSRQKTVDPKQDSPPSSERSDS